MLAKNKEETHFYMIYMIKNGYSSWVFGRFMFGLTASLGLLQKKPKTSVDVLLLVF